MWNTALLKIFVAMTAMPPEETVENTLRSRKNVCTTWTSRFLSVSSFYVTFTQTFRRLKVFDTSINLHFSSFWGILLEKRMQNILFVSFFMCFKQIHCSMQCWSVGGGVTKLLRYPQSMVTMKCYILFFVLRYTWYFLFWVVSVNSRILSLQLVSVCQMSLIIIRTKN